MQGSKRFALSAFMFCIASTIAFAQDGNVVQSAGDTKAEVRRSGDQGSTPVAQNGQNQPQQQPAAGPQQPAQPTPAPTPEAQPAPTTPEAQPAQPQTAQGQTETAPTTTPQGRVGWPLRVNNIEERIGFKIVDVRFYDDPTPGELGCIYVRYQGTLPREALPIRNVRWVPIPGREEEVARQLGDRKIAPRSGAVVDHPRLGPCVALFWACRSLAESFETLGRDGDTMTVTFTTEELGDAPPRTATETSSGATPAPQAEPTTAPARPRQQLLDGSRSGEVTESASK